MRGIVGLTGTPGTGKKTVAPLAAETLGLPIVSLNELAEKLGLLGPGNEVDTSKMRRLVSRDIMGPSLVFGHLLPYVVERRAAERVAVLRCEPSVLKGRLLARGYPPRKVGENVEAELIGVVSSDAYDEFGNEKAFEVDTTKSDPSEVAKKIVAVVRGSKPSPRIDWTVYYDSGERLMSLLDEKE